MKKLAAILTTTLLTGCATLVSGVNQPITVVTPSNGAKCKLTDTYTGEWYIPNTPSTSVIRKGDGPLTITCSQEGYKTTKLTVEESINGLVFGNILLGGLIGLFVDMATGAAQQYPDKIAVWMEPKQGSFPEERRAFEETHKENNKAINKAF